jgi:hypothetical protein
MKKRKGKVKLIYLASPYSHKNRSMEYKRFYEITFIAAQLISKYGHAMFLPITQSHVLKDIEPHLFGTSFEFWKDIDLSAIDHSDEVWVVKLDGWKESIGVCAEIAHAKASKIPVKYVDHKTVKFVRG